MAQYNEKRFYKVIMFKDNKGYMLFEDWTSLSKYLHKVLQFTTETDKEKTDQYDCTGLTGWQGKFLFWWYLNIRKLKYTTNKEMTEYDESSQCDYVKDSVEPCKNCPRKITMLYKCKLLQESKDELS